MTRRPATPEPSRVLLATDAGRELADLEPLVLRIFGAGDRPPGWFPRKLAREGVDPACSSLAFGPGDELLGYLLVGADPDPPGPPVAHCAGLGVLPDLRGRGLGPALVACSVTAARRRAAALHALAEPALRGFYERLGFRSRALRHTLWAPGTGAADLDLRALPRLAWALPGRAVTQWRAGNWSRTPDDEAATLRLPDADAWAHLSREGAAVLIQRLCIADEPDAPDEPDAAAKRIHAALAELRAYFHSDTAVLLYGCDTVSCVTASLIQAKWRVAQTACEMQRNLGDAVDNDAPPAA